MNILRRRTSNGYVLELLCDECRAPVKRLDAQTPLWSVVVDDDEHAARYHQTRSSDDAEGVVAYRHPRRKVETVELPEPKLCGGCGEPADKGLDRCV